LLPLSWSVTAAFLLAPILWQARLFFTRRQTLPVVAVVGIVWVVITFQGAERMFDHRERIVSRFPEIYRRMSW
jgi:hypothetical protein